MIAIVLVLLFTGAALSVDLGNAWQEKRHLHTATDAAALAAAQDYALNVNGCASTAGSYLTNNDSNAQLTGCSTSTTSSTSGYVSVSAKTKVDYVFGKVVGLNSTDVHSTTVAAYGNPKSLGGLRPMGLCLYANPELASWLNLPAGPTGPSGTIRIIYSKSQPDACGTNVPGNWGMMNFDGGSNSNAVTKDWVLNGYPGQVPLSPPDVPGNPGAFSNSISSELNTLINQEFQLPVFDQASGNGANSQFRIVAFVTVKLIGFKSTGPQADRYLDLQFLTRIAHGPCCSNGLNTGTKAVDICAVESDFTPGKCSPS